MEAVCPRTAAGERHFALPVELVVFEVALIGIAVFEGHLALPAVFIVFEPTDVYIAAFPPQRSFAVKFPIFPLTRVVGEEPCEVGAITQLVDRRTSAVGMSVRVNLPGVPNSPAEPHFVLSLCGAGSSQFRGGGVFLLRSAPI